MNVLVVDDVPLNRVVIGRILRSLRLNVIEAENGHEGLQAYLRHGRDIAFVLLDLVMPVLDGFNAALGIRSAESRRGWLPVPIVAYTSEDVKHGSPIFQRCMRSGFNDVVPKPMSRRHATQLLSRWLPGLSAGSSSSGASSDEEVQCGCSQSCGASCSKCGSSFATASAAAFAAGAGQQPGRLERSSSGGEGSDGSRPSGAGSGDGPDGGSSASSACRAVP